MVPHPWRQDTGRPITAIHSTGPAEGRKNPHA